jgi:hypothetical protein
MSQIIWNEIIPTATSGTQLATILNDFKNAVVSGLSGTSRPTELQAGGNWIDTTNDGIGLWDFKVYTGTTDITLFTLNKNTGTASISSTDTEFEIFKSSSDTEGGLLKFLKERASGTQVLAGDALGEIDFVGTRNDTVEATQARISVISTDNVTSTTQGSSIVFEAVNTGTAALEEKARLLNGNLGVGTSTPGERIVARGNIKAERVVDSAVGPVFIGRKSRIASSGQVVNADSIIKLQGNSTDSTGAEVQVGSIEMLATQNHSDTARGVEINFNATVNDAATPSLAMKIGSTAITLYRNLVASLVNGSVVTPTRLDVKQDTEANLITYAATATDGQLLFATDIDSYFGVVGGEIVPLGGGAGGSSLLWEKDVNGPITEYVNGIKSELFDDESDQKLYATIAVPLSYRTGDQISLKSGLVASAATTGNILFVANTAIYKPGVVFGSTPATHESVNAEITVPGVANTLATLGTIDLTDADGEINAVAVAPGDKLVIELKRFTSEETSSAAGDAKLLINTFELSFS